MKVHYEPFKHSTFFSSLPLAVQSVPVYIQKLSIVKLLWLINQTEYYIGWSVIICSSQAQLHLAIYLSKPQIQTEANITIATLPSGPQSWSLDNVLSAEALSLQHASSWPYAKARLVAILATAQSALLYLGLSLKTTDDNLWLKALNEIHLHMEKWFVRKKTKHNIMDTICN